MSVDGFTPTPCTKHCAVVIAQHQTSRRNHSLPTLRSKSPAGADLQRASTGRGHRRPRQTDVSVLPSRSTLASRQSVETELTDVQTLASDADEKDTRTSETDSCCDVCTSTLRRNHRVGSQPTPCDNCDDILFNSSLEQLIVEPDTYAVRAAVSLSQTQNIKACNDINCSGCTDADHGTDNPTFMSDDITSHHTDGYTARNRESIERHDHLIAAQALKQPVNSEDTEELSDKEQERTDASMEMACFSLCRNGNRLVIEDLESDSGVISSDTMLVESNGISHRPLDVREAWPDTTSVSTDRVLSDAGDEKQLLVCIICLNVNYLFICDHVYF